MQIQLPTGNTISMSVYDYYFALKEEDVDLFFQSCIADNLGTYIDNPFSNKVYTSTIDEVDVPDEIIKDIDNI